MTTDIVQTAAVHSAFCASDTIVATFAATPTPGNQIVAVHDLNLGGATMTWPTGFIPATIIDELTGNPVINPGVHVATKDVEVGEDDFVTGICPGGDRSTMFIYEVPPSTFNGAIVRSTGNPFIFPTVSPTGTQNILIACVFWSLAYNVSTYPTGWTQDHEGTAFCGGQGILGTSFHRVEGPGTYGGTMTAVDGSAGGPVVVLTFEPPPPPAPTPGIWTVR